MFVILQTGCFPTAWFYFDLGRRWDRVGTNQSPVFRRQLPQRPGTRQPRLRRSCRLAAWNAEQSTEWLKPH